MKKSLATLLTALILFSCGWTPACIAEPTETDAVWKQVSEAYIYAFPLVLTNATKTMSTNTDGSVTGRAPVNQINHAKRLADASFRTVVTPNVDTLYSQAWLDIGAEPMVYVLPETDRFCNVQLLDAWTNTAAVLDQAGAYVIALPSWTGELPENVTRVDVPAEADAALLEKLAAIHVGPGMTFDASILGADAAERWTQMLKGMRATLSAESAKYAQNLGQWIYFGRPIGDFGTAYTYRAMVALVGLGANTVDVAIYPKTHTDAAGAALTGEKTYTIHFETLPPTLEGGFWSVTAYNEENFLIDNPIDRYCVNDRSAYRLNEDGTLDITLSKEAPEDPSNWLPVSDGEFHLFMRIYLPDMNALDAWQPPVIHIQE